MKRLTRAKLRGAFSEEEARMKAEAKDLLAMIGRMASPDLMAILDIEVQDLQQKYEWYGDP